jgi:hypothetical protein
MRSRRLKPIVALLVPMLAAGAGSRARSTGAREWRTASFLDFAEGSCADGGANTYVAADGTVRLINLWDLDNDGNLDLVLAATHDNNEKLPLTVYWQKDGFSAERKSELPTEGAKAVAIADCNRDGRADLVVANNFDGTRTELNSYVYWNGPAGFDARRRTELPTVGAEAVTVADLDGDGFPDLVFACSGLTYHVAVDRLNQSYIYWGAASGYAAERRTVLRTVNARDVAVADFDRDGRLDLAFAEEGNSDAEGGATIYYGGPGRSYGRRLHLPGERSSALAAGDLDGDGYPDLALANAFRLRGRELDIYDIVDTAALSSYIYWNSRAGFSAARRTELPTVAASSVAVGDCDGDGRADVVFASSAAGAAYVYWNGPAGFRPHRRTAIPTLRASGCRVVDLDGDGRLDLVVTHRSDGRSHDTRSWIYWGTATGFSAARRTELPTHGATGVAAGDLDGDGRLDLVFANKADGTAGEPVESWIYWGNSKGEFTPERRQALPTSGPNSYAAADLDNDGFVDLFMPERESAIYWGGKGGYAKTRRTVVSSRGAFSGRAADFNRDGYLDLALSEWTPGGDETGLYSGGPGGFSPANRFAFKIGSVRAHAVADLDRDGWLDVIFSTTADQVVIFWNSPTGFDNKRRTVLPAASAVSVEVADLDADGWLDVIVANLFDTHPAAGATRAFGGSPEANTFIYWGGKSGYSAERRTVLPSVGNEDIGAADLDGDGRLDLVLTSYHAGSTRNHPSTIYWNGPRGFDPKRFTELPTHSGSGVIAADFNRDGYKDLFFTCHSYDGNHRTDSFLYWGGKSGYSAARRSSIPGIGPHFMTVADIGNVYDRGERYDYVSPPFDAGAGARFASIEWRGETPFQTRLEFQVRAAATPEALQQSSWLGPEGPGSYYRSPGAALTGLAAGARWIQYRASLVSPDSLDTPVLRAVSIRYDAR